jgi:hypothetical protein
MTKKIDNEWSAHAQHGADLLDDMCTLRAKEDDDGVQKTDEREGTDVAYKPLFVALRTKERAQRNPSENRSSKRFS